MVQASVYEVCDATHMPLHTPKTLEPCKKKHTLFDKKSFKLVADCMSKTMCFVPSFFTEAVTRGVL